ncbi:MAG: hypothetical protein AVDCRST_MAG89-1030 [uncultured Gemmatimonadetes bacterium]|uniref:Sulfotransferase domain-containing protein n=1 Tax=uncultured Gemmatimonadota bacterium TaxID=203437 RepID=A0A6J4KN93_9BACT|nr:MAG: hypothetical protein AVDCRST_MAG89-1030 [uncultured Gemmatimonadota bacterium]
MPQHLIHIGFPKAGSTFLQQWFAKHPRFHYTPGGFAGFRDIYGLARVLDTPFDYYVTSTEDFSSPRSGSGALHVHLPSGASRPEPVKSRQATVCGVLRTLFPGARILIITRGFRSLMRSVYSQAVRSGLTQSVKAQYESYAALPQTGDFRHHDYDYLIGLYTAAFGRENVIVLPYELLRDDQARFIRVLEDRLGVEHADMGIGRVNPSLTPEELYWYPVISRAVSAVVAPLGEKWHRRIFTRYVRLMSRNHLRLPVRVLARARPHARVTDADFPAGIEMYQAGRAESLLGDPLYAPYAEEYLWDRETAPGGATPQTDHSAAAEG